MYLIITHTTLEKPQVIRIAHLCEIDPDAVVGKLLRVWAWFQRHADTPPEVSDAVEPGHIPGVGVDAVDLLVRTPGFGDAMVQVGWLNEDDHGLRMPDFAKYTSLQARQRAKERDKKRRQRAGSRAFAGGKVVDDAGELAGTDIGTKGGTSRGQEGDGNRDPDSDSDSDTTTIPPPPPEGTPAAGDGGGGLPFGGEEKRQRADRATVSPVRYWLIRCGVQGQALDQCEDRLGDLSSDDVVSWLGEVLRDTSTARNPGAVAASRVLRPAYADLCAAISASASKSNRPPPRGGVSDPTPDQLDDWEVSQQRAALHRRLSDELDAERFEQLVDELAAQTPYLAGVVERIRKQTPDHSEQIAKLRTAAAVVASVGAHLAEQEVGT